MRIVRILIALIAGIAIGVAAVFLWPAITPGAQQEHVQPSVVFERIVAKNELVCASQSYNITEKVTQKPERFFELFDIPFTDTNFWYRYVGTIKVGVDLKTAAMALDGDTIEISLRQPYIISNAPDMNKSGVLETNDNLFSHVKPADIDNFQRDCIRVSEEGAIADGIMDEAKEYAQTNLTDMFQAALGDTAQVEIVWR